MSIITTLWQDKDFGGLGLTSTLSGGRYRWNTWAGHNDMFSSMRTWTTGGRGDAYAFDNIDFSGHFAALTVGDRYTSAWWSYFGDSFNDRVSSSLMVARESRDRESEVQLKALVTGQFAAIFDSRVQGKPVSRAGDPRLYATFFPSFAPDRVFATIDQALTVKVRIPLKVTIPNPFGDDWEIDLGTFRWLDYSARVRYHVRFFVIDGVMHGVAEWVSVWVEAGVFSQRVFDDLAPQLRNAASSLTSAIESALALFNRQRFADVYLLPGPAPDPQQAGFQANYDDDVTLVAVRR